MVYFPLFLSISLFPATYPSCELIASDGQTNGQTDRQTANHIDNTKTIIPTD